MGGVMGVLTSGSCLMNSGKLGKGDLADADTADSSEGKVEDLGV